MPHIVDEEKVDGFPEAESNDNLTVTQHEEKPAETNEDQMVLDEAASRPDVSVEEDGGHFNNNKDNQPIFSATDEMQEVPQATLENPLDTGLDVEVEPSPSGWYFMSMHFYLFRILKPTTNSCSLDFKMKVFPSFCQAPYLTFIYI